MQEAQNVVKGVGIGTTIDKNIIKKLTTTCT
jgi:hypothetical protein